MKKGEMKSSLAAGGRWDKMISNFLETKREFPAVGISFGIEPITAVMKTKKESIVDIYVIPIRTLKESIKIVQKLRNSGIKAEIDLLNRNIGKNLDYADKLSIPYVVLVGEVDR